MRRLALLVSAAVVVILPVVDAQGPARALRTPAAADARAALPVRRVVLYKNGVGYFEHLGTVRDSGSVNIDFNSAQLDDALKSLTALDLGNGRITGISYNSDAPLGQRLAALRLPVGDRTTLPDLLGALRGARLEVRSGDRLTTGRILGVERRVVGAGAAQTSRDELTLVTDAGDIRTVELTTSVTVRLAERDSAEQVSSYLGLLASTRAIDRRRMTIATAGTGQRDLLVSYVSEVPIWKTSYRVVLPPDGEQPLLQGWAIVDNTTGEDWTNIDLSLVAGAPQSFIQQISQPRYARRPVVQPSQAVLLTPQTHDPTLIAGAGRVRGTVRDASSAVLPGVSVRVVDAFRRTVGTAVTDRNGGYALEGLLPGNYRAEFTLPGFETVVSDVVVGSDGDASRDAVLRLGSVGESVTVSGEAPRMANARVGMRPGIAGGVGGVEGGVVGGITGGLVQAPLAAPARPQDIQPAAAPRELTDLFEYRLNSPISIPRNQSALVPILNAGVSIERVSVWNGRTGAQPLRALWLTNTTGLTLDGGSFTVLDEGAFAGEGLTDPLKPDEKRLLSYAVDLGVQVESRQGDELKVVTRLTAQHGVIVEHREQRMRRVYTVRNNDKTPRTILIEHPFRAGWTLANGVKPAETSATAYRFRLSALSKETETLVVEEKQPSQDTYEVSALTDEQVKVFVRDTGGDEKIRLALAPIVALKTKVATLAATLADRAAEIEQITGDENRIRENLRALKDTSGNKPLIKRYTAQLTESEERIDGLRKLRQELDRERSQANAELTKLVEQLALSIEVAPVD